MVGGAVSIGVRQADDTTDDRLQSAANCGLGWGWGSFLHPKLPNDERNEPVHHADSLPCTATANASMETTSNTLDIINLMKNYRIRANRIEANMITALEAMAACWRSDRWRKPVQ